MKTENNPQKETFHPTKIAINEVMIIRSLLSLTDRPRKGKGSIAAKL